MTNKNQNIDWNKVLCAQNGMDDAFSYDDKQKYLKMFDLGFRGYFQKTNQYCIQISFEDGRKIDKMEEGINNVLPFLVSFDLSQYGIKEGIYLDIFDFDLSEYANFALCQDVSDNSWWIVGSRYHRGKKFRQFQNLRDALDYIREYHPRTYRDGLPSRERLYEFYR